MAALRVSAFRPDHLWQQAREPIFWLDQALRVSWVNRAWEEFTGHSAESILGRTCVGYGPGASSDPADVVASFLPPREALGGEPAGTMTVILHPDGERLWRRIEFWPFLGHGGTLIGILGRIRDVTASPSVPDSQAHQLRVQLMQLREWLHQTFQCECLVGTGPAHRRLLEQIRLASGSMTPVLIVGEPGTGKRLVARTVHQMSPYREFPLVPIDCEALPPDAIEHLLRDRATTGEFTVTAQNHAADPRHGRLALTKGSGILIGDILALSRDLQARIAQILDAGVRVIAMTEGDVQAALEQEVLLPELYHKLSVLVIRTIPLRERRYDLMLLAQTLLERTNQRTGTSCGGFSPDATSALQNYDWPGNVSELARVIDAAHGRVGAQTDSENLVPLIEAADLPAEICGNLGAAYLPPAAAAATKPLDELLTEIERRLIETALVRARQNKSRAAEFLGISRPRLYRRIKELNLPDDYEPDNGAPGIASASKAEPLDGADGAGS